MGNLHTLFIRSAVLGIILLIIWEVMGPDIIKDVLDLEDQAIDDIRSLKSFDLYPLWLQAFLILIGIFFTILFLMTGYFLFIIIDKIVIFIRR